MRKFFFVLAVFSLLSSMAAADTIISSDTFPDKAFREHIRQFDTNSDNILQDNEIAAVSMLDVQSCDISSLEGIEIFTGLRCLICAGCPIADSLDIHNLICTTFIHESDDAKTFVFSNILLGKNIDSSSIKGFDSNGEPVNLVSYNPDNLLAVFDAEPAIVVYSYNTGLENITLSAALLSDTAKTLAPCSNGIFEGKLSGDVVSWKGVPYAKSPTGSLRWKAPQAPDTSSEHFTAFTYAAMPIQHYSSTNPPEILPHQGEDCLALNVWNKSRDMSALKPVMVWVHGGGFNSGSTAHPDYNGENFIAAHDDVVLVSVGYRVGIMGFIDFVNSGIPGCENFPDSQNLGLLDILQAMRWIKENIAAFGGDPENITVFGQSSGSATVSLLLAMPESAGLFRRAVTQSGGVSLTASIEECRKFTQELVRVTGADTMDKLMALSSADLRQAVEKLKPYLNFPERDGRIVAANPYEAFAKNSANFDILTGTMQDEVKYYSLAMGGLEAFGQFVENGYYQIVNGINAVSSEDAARAGEFVKLYMSEHDGAAEYEAMAAFLNDLLFRGATITEANSHTGKTYVYYWEYPSIIPGIGACHALDVPYIFNDSSNFLVSGGYNQTLADEVQAMWVNFAKTGSPSTGSITWPEYDVNTQATMLINEAFAVRNSNLANYYELIQPLMKYWISGRDLNNAIHSGGKSTESEDVTPVGSSSGSCNAGCMFPMMIAVMFAAKRKL